MLQVCTGASVHGGGHYPEPKGQLDEDCGDPRSERENARLREELRKARIVIDVQGKVAGLLGLSLGDGKRS